MCTHTTFPNHVQHAKLLPALDGVDGLKPSRKDIELHSAEVSSVTLTGTLNMGMVMYARPDV